MKKITFLLVSFLVIVSCNIDDNGETPETPVNLVNENNTVQAQVSGVTFASIDTNTFAEIIDETNLRIAGGDGAAILEILIGGYTGVGLYELESGNPDSSLTATYTIPSTVGAPDRVWNIVSDPSSAGELMVTEASESSVSGTFSITLINELEESTLVFSSGTLTVEL